MVLCGFPVADSSPVGQVNVNAVVSDVSVSAIYNGTTKRPARASVASSLAHETGKDLADNVTVVNIIRTDDNEEARGQGAAINTFH